MWCVQFSGFFLPAVGVHALVSALSEAQKVHFSLVVVTLLDVTGVLFSGVRFLIEKNPGKLATFSTMCDTDAPILML